MQQAVKTEQERRLALGEVIDWLVADKLVDPGAAEQLKKERRYYRGTLHPLVIVADQKWKNATPPHRPLTKRGVTLLIATLTAAGEAEPGNRRTGFAAAYGRYVPDLLTPPNNTHRKTPHILP